MQANSEALYRALFEATSDGIVVLDDADRCVQVNDSFCRLLKAPREQLIGTRLSEFVPPERRAQAGAVLRHRLTGEFPLQALDGSLVELEWTAGESFLPGLHFCIAREIGRRKAAERQAAENAERQRQWLETTLASIGDAVIVTDERGRVTFLNAVAQELTGWTEAQAQAQPLPELFRIVNEVTGELVPNPVEKVLETGHVTELASHTVLIARDGTERAIDDSAAPIRNQAGELAGAVLIFRDISERRRLEIDAHRLAAIITSSDDAIVSKDLNGIVTSWNRGAERIFGYTAEEMIGQPIALLVPPERPDEEPAILARIRKGERIDHYETVRVRKDGTRIDVSVTISPVRDEEGRIVGASKVARDISAQKQALEMAAHLAAIVESSDDAIISKDLNGIVRSWNRAAERIYGYPAEEMIGKPIALLVPPERPDEEPALLERLRGGERIEHYETTRVRKDGSRIDVSLTVSPVKNAAGEIVGASKVVRDITQEKALRRELERRVRELAEADRRKDQFLAMLAHELRNPLGAISNAVHILHNPHGNDTTRTRAVQVLRRQVQHQARIVNELLDVSRITRGLIELHPEPLDFVRLVRETADDYRAALEQERIALHIELPEAPVWVSGDPTRLSQVVSNLLSNALKFTPAGGRVTVGVGGWGLGAGRDGTDRKDQTDRADQVQPLTPDAQRPTPNAVLTVRDTGIGIEPELLPHVFDSFSQGDRTLARSRGGLGLGLAIVKGLVELHGGEVAIESAGPSQGTTVRVLLPALPALEERSEQIAPRRAGRALRVLVVEDHRDVADTLRDLLELNGNEVQVALTGPEGVRVAREYHPDVILCDLGLPGMNGYEVAATLRTAPGGAQQRLIAVTGYGQEEDRRRTREAGFQAHLVKPIDPEELQQVLRLLADDMAGLSSS